MNMDSLENLRNKILNKTAIIGVIGLGYVGFPLFLGVAKNNYMTLGFDIDHKKIDKINSGQSYINYITSEEVINLLENKNLKATYNFSDIRQCDIIIICVPTPLTENKEPNISYILDSANSISKYFKKGHLIILESTTYPGTTLEEVLPIFTRGGFKVGKDFYLGFSPERVDPGNKNISIFQIPKIVSGVTDDCLNLVDLLYKQLFQQTIKVSSPSVAEAAKLLENIYRSVNIALVNEMKIILDKMDIDIWEVIEAASTKPFGFTPFYPGPGFGGHCIPIDPFYLAWKANRNNTPAKFIELAGEVNAQMPLYVVERILSGLKNCNKEISRSNILLLGLAYKKDIGDTRESPSLQIMSILKENGANVDYNDPYVPYLVGVRKYPSLNLESVPLNHETLGKYDCVVIVTDHSCYDWENIVRNSELIIDTRNATNQLQNQYQNIIKA